MRVVITRARENSQAFADLLKAAHCEPVLFPAITIEPVLTPETLQTKFSNIHSFDWLIFTSANGVEIFFDTLAQLGLELSGITRIAAVGDKTAERLKAYDRKADYVPANFLGERIIDGLGDLQRKKILLPVADIADPALPDALKDAGALVEVVTTYRTASEKSDPDALALIREGVDVITFTSGSTARNFYSLILLTGLDPLRLPGPPVIACIGPKTAAEAEKLGFSVSMTANPHTIEGLVNVITRYRKEMAS